MCTRSKKAKPSIAFHKRIMLYSLKKNYWFKVGGHESHSIRMV